MGMEKLKTLNFTAPLNNFAVAAAASSEKLVNGADEENWVEVRSSSSLGGLQTASEAATNSSPGNSWQQMAPVVATSAAGNFAEQSSNANWTYIDGSGLESVTIYTGLLPAPPPPAESHGSSDVRFHGGGGGVFRPRGSRGRGGGGGRGHYQRGISNNVAR